MVWEHVVTWGLRELEGERGHMEGVDVESEQPRL